jgi:hypothetical protein
MRSLAQPKVLAGAGVAALITSLACYPRLRAETTMTWGWIARRLEMGHWRTAANAVRRAAVKRKGEETHQ